MKFTKVAAEFPFTINNQAEFKSPGPIPIHLGITIQIQNR